MENKAFYNTIQNSIDTSTSPVLIVEFMDSFGQKSQVRKELRDETINSVYDAMREACLGFGFHPDNVGEFFDER